MADKKGMSSDNPKEGLPKPGKEGPAKQVSVSEGNSSHGSISQGATQGAIISLANSSHVANHPPSRQVPIAALRLGMEMKTDSFIRGLVVCKSEVRTSWTKFRTRYFSFEMRDEAGDEIRVVCFKQQVERFFHKVEEGKVLILNRFSLQPPRKEFNPTHRDCEIVLEYDSVVCVDPWSEDL